MRTEEIIINVIFDAAKGTVSVASREAVCGQALGMLPRPTRSGYTFEGWYLNGELVTEGTVLNSEEDVRLVAHWSKKKGASKKNSMLKKQKIAVVVLAVLTVVLALTLVFVNHIVSIYGLEDTYYGEDGTAYTEKYYVRKKGGVYGLYDSKGNLMEKNEDGYYIANSGNQYSVDAETGEYELYAVVDYDAAGGEVLGFSDRIMMFPQITQKNMYSIKVTNEHGSFEFYRDKTGTVLIRGTEDALVSYDQTLFASLCVSCGYTLTMQKLDLTSDASTAPRLEDGSVDYSAYGLADIYDENNELVYTPATYTITKAIYAEDGTCTSDPDNVYTVKVGSAILSGAGYYVQLEGRGAVYIVSSSIADTVLQPVEALVTPMVTYPMTMTTYSMIDNFLLGTMNFGGNLEDIDDIEIDPIVAFTYEDLEARENSIYTSRPYICQTELMKGYEINDNSVSTVMGLLYEMEFVACRKIGLTKEALREYGLDGDIFYLTFGSPVLDDSNNIEGYMENMLMISQKTENGTYYIASFLTDMIVEVDQYYLSFLEWELNEWYDQYFFQYNISHISSMSFRIGDKTFDFKLDNSASYMYYEKSEGTMSLVDLTKGTIERKRDGSIVYVDQSGTRHNVKAFDFNTGAHYIKILDSDGDVEAYAPYEKYVLSVDKDGIQTLTVYQKDSNGNETSAEYAITSKAGGTLKQIRAYKLIYRDANGEEYDVLGMYSSSDGQTYKDYYRLAYWKQSYDEAQQKYVWTRTKPINTSSYVMLRDSNNKEYSISVGSGNLQVYCDQYAGNNSGLLDYTIVNTYITDKGTEKTETIEAVDNFRKLYTDFMWYSIEGSVNEADFQKNLGMSMKEYIAQGDDACQAIFTFHVEDAAKNLNLDSGVASTDDKSPELKSRAEDSVMDVVVRLYRYSERKSLITIEIIENYDENGNPISDPTNVETAFYVLSTYADRLLGDAERLLAQQKVEQD